MPQHAWTGDRWEIQVWINEKNEVTLANIQETVPLPRLSPWQQIRAKLNF